MSVLLSTLEEVKQYLKIDTPQQDEFLESLIESLSSAIEVYLGRFVIERNIEDEPHYHAQDSRFLHLDFYPVTEVRSVNRDGVELDKAQFKADKSCGILKKIYGTWGEVVFVSYRAGIAADTQSVPKDIKLALCGWIQSIITRNGGDIKSETLGDYSVSYNTEEHPMPALTQALLENYRRHNV